MSKEMTIILLGLLNIVLATHLLAIPGSWATSLFVISGAVLMVLGFLLRGEALTRDADGHRPFVENGASAASHADHDKERITSLN